MANYNDNGPVNPIYGFPFITSYSPVIPKLYWGVSSQEQRILEICQAVDELGRNLYDTASTVNNLLDEMTGVSNKIEALDQRLTAVEAGDHTGGGGTADGSIGDRVTKLEQTTTTQGNAISAIDGRVTTNASGIAGLVSSTNALGDRVTALENASSSDPNGLSGRVTALENDNTSNKTSIKANADAISGHDTRLTTIEQQVSDQKGINTSVDGKIKTINDKVAAMDSELSDASVSASTALSNAATALSTAKDAASNVTAMDKRVTTNSTNISSLQDSVDSLTGKVSTNITSINALKDNAATDEKNIANLQDSLKTTNTTVDGLTKDLKTARTDIDSNTAAIAAAKTSINDLSNNLATTNTNLATANESITDVKNRVADTEKNITSVKTSISDTNKAVKANTDAITSATDSVKALSEKTDGIKTDLATSQTNISALQDQQGTNTHDISELKTNDAGHEKAINSLTSQMTGAVGDISNLQKRVGDLEHDAANQPASRGLQSRMGIGEYVLTRDTDPSQPDTPDIANIAQRLVTVEEGVGNLTTRADTMDRWGKSIETRVTALENRKPDSGSGSDTTELTNRVTAVESDLTTAKKDISALETSSEDYGKRIKALEDKPGYDDTALVNRISAVESDNKTIHTNLDSNNQNINNHETRIHSLELTLDGGKDTDGNTVTALTDTVSSNTARIKTLEDKGSGSTDTGLADRVSKVETDLKTTSDSVTDHGTRLTKIETDLYDHKEENGSTIAGALTELHNGVAQAFGAIDEINGSLLDHYDPDKEKTVPGLNSIVMNGWTDSTTNVKWPPMTTRVSALEATAADHETNLSSVNRIARGNSADIDEIKNDLSNAIARLDNVPKDDQGGKGKLEEVITPIRQAAYDYLTVMYGIDPGDAMPKRTLNIKALHGMWNVMFADTDPKDARWNYDSPSMAGGGIWQLVMATAQRLRYTNGISLKTDDGISVKADSGKTIYPLYDESGHGGTLPFYDSQIDDTPTYTHTK